MEAREEYEESCDEYRQILNVDCKNCGFQNDGTENATAFTDKIPQECMQDEELSKTLDFTGENTHVMTMDDMMNIRYREFNKTLTDLATLVDVYSADKKTLKYIKGEYIRTYTKYFDVIKHMYNLDIADKDISPGTTADRVLYKREVVEPKRVTLPNGKKLHVYTNKDGQYQFIDEVFANGEGISLQDLAFWLENRDNFTDSYCYVENSPIMINIFGRIAYIPIKGLRIPKSGNVMLDRYYAILARIHKQIGDMLQERKKVNAKRGVTDTDLIEEDEEEN